MSDKSQIVMFHKESAKLKQSDISKLRKAGFLVVGCEDFDAVSFPAAATQAIGFITPTDDMGVLMLRAATKAIGFEGEIGKEVVRLMKQRAGITDKAKS